MKTGYAFAALTAVLGTLFAASSCQTPADQVSAPSERVSGIERGGMDTEIRPQDDFHQYANGSWLRTTTIPDQYSSYSPFVILRENAESQQREIIESLSTSNAQAGTIERQIGDYYASFMDTEAVQRAGLAPLHDDLEAIAAASSKADIARLFADFIRAGLIAPLAMEIDQDLEQSDRYTAYLSQSGLGLPNRDYYLETDNPRFRKVLAAYPEYIAKLFALAGIEQGEASAKAIVELETRIAEIQWSAIDNRNLEKIYNPMSVPQLQTLNPAIDWPTLLGSIGIGDLEQIIVTQPDYIEGLGKLVGEVPLSTWQAYLQLRLLSGYAPYLTDAFVTAEFDFYGRVIGGRQQQKERWRRGIDVTNAALGEAVGQLYVARHFPPQARARMQALVDNLLAEFASRIDQLQWMGPQTKQAARDKLAKFTVKIGYPDQWRDYSGLSVQQQDLIANLRASQAFEYNYQLNKLGKPVDPHEWHMTPQTVNAYYNPVQNEIVFPAAILQPPFFSMQADDAVNYGAIGMVIGHEISHGFDDQGSRFDGDGNMRNWWTEQDRKQFEARTAQLVAQYDRYEPIPGMHVKGKLTLGENIGDLSGLTVAYYAYQRSLHGKPAPVIDGYTGDQRFFLGLAQAWRAKYRDEALAEMITSDPHSPPRYRVNGVVVNMTEFYRAFDVQPGDALYLPPQQRVQIW